MNGSTSKGIARFFTRQTLGFIFMMAGWWKCFELTPLEHAEKFFIGPGADLWVPNFILWPVGSYYRATGRGTAYSGAFSKLCASLPGSCAHHCSLRPLIDGSIICYGQPHFSQNYSIDYYFCLATIRRCVGNRQFV